MTLSISFPPDATRAKQLHELADTLDAIAARIEHHSIAANVRRIAAEIEDRNLIKIRAGLCEGFVR